MKRTPFISTSRLRGCLIAIGGVSYRITKVHRGLHRDWAGFRTVHDGRLECLHIEPQFARVLQNRDRRFLWLGHLWLQHSHKGVIVAFAEVRRVGRTPGPDRWLRVPSDFPYLPSAAAAVRVEGPWRRRTSRPVLPMVASTGGPLEPLNGVELFAYLEGMG